ncbi:MAG TPA: GGDEF domain-containing protein, partial [Thermoanaerobaculia bacterium]
MSAAEAVTLYLPGGEDGTDGVFLHEGSAPPVPELADAASAARFIRRASKRLDASRSPAEGAGQWASEAPACRLVRLPAVEALFLLATEGPAARRSGRRRTDPAPSPLGEAWVGFRFDREPGHFPALGEPLVLPAAPLDPVEDADSWSWVLAVGSALAWTSRRVSETLRDSVSGLPGRVELQSVLERLVERARTSGQPLTLVFFNPDDFAAINESLGRATGDRVIREMARRIRSLHRATDFVGRYGGAVFASALVDTGLEDGRMVAEKVRSHLSGESFLGGKLALSFTAGVAAYGGSSEETGDGVSEMIRLADAALGVGKREGGDRTVVWDEGIREQAPESHDRLRGIFTADVERDYRNMALLLDTLSTFATAEEVPQLLSDVTRRIASIFKPDRIGVFRR